MVFMGLILFCICLFGSRSPGYIRHTRLRKNVYHLQRPVSSLAYSLPLVFDVPFTCLLVYRFHRRPQWFHLFQPSDPSSVTALSVFTESLPPCKVSFSGVASGSVPSVWTGSACSGSGPTASPDSSASAASEVSASRRPLSVVRRGSSTSVSKSDVCCDSSLRWPFLAVVSLLTSSLLSACSSAVIAVFV